MANSKKAIASQASIKRAGIFKDAAIDTINRASNSSFVCMVNLNCILATYPEWGQKGQGVTK